MDNVSLWFLLLLIVVSGVIAAFGDALGRRLGKKRLRIGRLRPKHTAILMTFISGMLITVLTIAILSSMSGRVRTWLVEGEKLQDQLSETQSQVEQSEKEVADVKSQLAKERENLRAEELKVEEATAESKKLSEAAAELRGEVADVTSRLAASTREYKAIQVEYKSLSTQSDELRSDIRKYADEQEELYAQQKTLMDQIAKFEIEIEGLESQISNLTIDAKKAEEDKLEAIKGFEKEKTRIQEERTRALADLSKTSLELADARRNLTSLQISASMIADENVRTRLNPVMYNRGDELARFTVRSKLNQAEAQSALVSAIEAASKEAVQRGAERAPDTRSSAAFMTYATREGATVTADMQFNQAVNEIVANQNDQLIVVRAMTNAFTGEWVRIRVDVYPNPIVYREGDLVIESRIDGTKGVQGVTQQIVEFIARQLRDRAISDGMVPATGRQPELGEISQEELQQVVGDIVQANRTVTLRFHARRETRASDTLSLDLRPR